MPRPKLLILTTGGTIQGAGATRLSLGEYRIGTTAAADMLAAVPELAELAEIAVEPLANLDSAAVDAPLLSRLIRRVRAAAADVGGFDAVLVTHGTDTLEETAFLLHLLIGTRRPVVVTGAMRPANGMSADGPVNLWNAARAAVAPASAGRGVLVAINEGIHSARDVAKAFRRGTDAFQSDAGLLGATDPDGVHYFRAIQRRHTFISEFTAADPARLPRVDVIASHQEATGDAVEASVRAGARGLVIDGAPSPSLRAAALAAIHAGVAVAVATHGEARRTRLEEADLTAGMIAAADFSARKARVLLRLALDAGTDLAGQRRIFDEY